MAYSRKKLDLTGHRYGKLTVIGPAENIGTRTAWLCRCDCGRETVVRSNRLRSGHTTSCGCVAPASGAGIRGLTYIDGTCVEMLRAKTVRRNNTSGVPGVDWWPGSIAGGRPSASRESGTIWAATAALTMRSRPERKRRRNSTTGF